MGEEKEKDDGDNDDWVNTPEAEELRKQMANLERKISKFKQEIEEADDEEEAKEMALIHCKQYLHEYVDDIWVEEHKEENENNN